MDKGKISLYFTGPASLNSSLVLIFQWRKFPNSLSWKEEHVTIHHKETSQSCGLSKWIKSFKGLFFTAEGIRGNRSSWLLSTEQMNNMKAIPSLQLDRSTERQTVPLTLGERVRENKRELAEGRRSRGEKTRSPAACKPTVAFIYGQVFIDLTWH